MPTFNELTELTDTLATQIQKYSDKPTKAESARLRATLGSIKNLVTPLRKQLVAADKAGY